MSGALGPGQPAEVLKAGEEICTGEEGSLWQWRVLICGSGELMVQVFQDSKGKVLKGSLQPAGEGHCRSQLAKTNDGDSC